MAAGLARGSVSRCHLCRAVPTLCPPHPMGHDSGRSGPGPGERRCQAAAARGGRSHLRWPGLPPRPPQGPWEVSCPRGAPLRAVTYLVKKTTQPPSRERERQRLIWFKKSFQLFDRLASWSSQPLQKCPPGQCWQSWADGCAGRLGPHGCPQHCTSSSWLWHSSGTVGWPSGGRSVGTRRLAEGWHARSACCPSRPSPRCPPVLPSFCLSAWHLHT